MEISLDEPINVHKEPTEQENSDTTETKKCPPPPANLKVEELFELYFKNGKSKKLQLFKSY